MPRVVYPNRAESRRRISLLSPNAPGEPGAISATVANRVKVALVLPTAARLNKQALGVGGTLCDDVDHAVHGVRAPHCRLRTSDHLNPVHIFEDHVLLVPIHAAKRAVVNHA